MGSAWMKQYVDQPGPWHGCWDYLISVAVTEAGSPSPLKNRESQLNSKGMCYSLALCSRL